MLDAAFHREGVFRGCVCDKRTNRSPMWLLISELSLLICKMNIMTSEWEGLSEIK